MAVAAQREDKEVLRCLRKEVVNCEAIQDACHCWSRDPLQVQIGEGKGLLSSASYDLVGHEPMRIVLRPLCKCLCKHDSTTVYA